MSELTGRWWPTQLNGGAMRRTMEQTSQMGQREQHLLKLLQEANRKIEELEAEKRSAK